MSDFFPLIVDGSGTPAIKEIPSGDVLDLTGVTVKAVSVNTTLAVAGASTLTGNTTIGGTLGVTGVITGSLTGNVTGSAATVTTAAQPNITSLGTLTGLTTTGNINLGDSDKINLGAGADLQIYHDGSNSYIDETGTGDLYIKLNNEIRIQGQNGNNLIYALEGGEVSLSHNGSERLQTTSTGVNLAGLATATQSANITQQPLATSGTTILWNALTHANAYLVPAANLTIDNPSNSVEGAIISVEIAMNGTPRTIAWHTNFEFAASTAPTVTATANKTDIFSFRYNGSVWQEIGRVQNLAQT